MMKMTGHCLCGNVSYTADAEPLITAICHCGTCQRQTGSTYSLVVGVPRESLTLSGETLASYQTITEATGTPSQRQFCSNCGSPVVTFAGTHPDLAIIKAGTLDDRKGLAPALEVHCDSAFAYAAAEPTERVRYPADLPT
jgi:hypothetical protein